MNFGGSTDGLNYAQPEHYQYFRMDRPNRSQLFRSPPEAAHPERRQSQYGLLEGANNQRSDFIGLFLGDKVIGFLDHSEVDV